MTDATKRKAILFLILAAVTTVLLAVTLPQFELQPGVPLPKAERLTNDSPGEGFERPPAINILTFIETVIGLFLFLAMIYLIARRRRRMNRREIIQILSALAMLSLTVTLILYAMSHVEVSSMPAEVEMLPVEIAIPVAGPPLAPLPASLLWLVWIGLAGLVLLLVIQVARVRARPKVAPDPLAVEAEQAIEAIRAGQGLSNVIIRCYQQMSRILQREQGLALEETMTAREFEALLEQRGFPNPPVRQLTRLFEIARYATQAPGPAEEAQALDCLNAIARYSQKRGPDKPK